MLSTSVAMVRTPIFACSPTRGTLLCMQPCARHFALHAALALGTLHSCRPAQGTLHPLWRLRRSTTSLTLWLHAPRRRHLPWAHGLARQRLHLDHADLRPLRWLASRRIYSVYAMLSTVTYLIH